jgi:hypothetical protein
MVRAGLRWRLLVGVGLAAWGLVFVALWRDWISVDDWIPWALVLHLYGFAIHGLRRFYDPEHAARRAEKARRMKSAEEVRKGYPSWW